LADQEFQITLDPPGPYSKDDEVTVKITLNPSHGTFSGKKSTFEMECSQFQPSNVKATIRSYLNSKVKIKGVDDGPIDFDLNVIQNDCAYDITTGLEITVNGLPKVSFDDPAITPLDDSVDLGNNEYPIGNANINLTLDAPAPSKGAKATVSSDAFSGEKEVKFAKGATTASVKVSLQETTGERSLTLAQKEYCIKASTCKDVPINVRSPKMKFSDSPYKSGVTEENGKNVCKPGDTISFNLEFDYKTPATAKGKLTSAALKKDKDFSVSKGNKTTSFSAEIGPEDQSKGDHKIRLINESGCGLDEPKLADISVIPPASITFEDGDNWIVPNADYCVGDKVTFKVKLNDEATTTKVYGKLQVGSGSAIDITFNEGEQTAEVSNVELTDNNKKTKVKITPEGETKKGAVTEKTIAVHQKNKVSIKSPAEEGPFYKGDKVKIPVALKYNANQSALAAKLKCDALFDETYDVNFQEGSQEAEVEVEIAKTPQEKKGTVTFDVEENFRIDDDAKSIELKTESIFEVSFANSKPTPEGPFYEGDKAKFTVKLSSAAREAGKVGTLTCTDAFDDVDIKFGKGEEEKEIEVTFKAVTEKKDLTATFEIHQAPYQEAEKNIESKFKLNPFPKIRYDTSKPITSGGKKVSDVWNFKARDEAQVRVHILEAPPQAGAKAKISCPSFESGYEVEFTEKGNKDITVNFKNPTDDSEVTLSKVSGCELNDDNIKFKAKVANKRTVNFASGEDWVTPKAPHFIKDKIKMKLALEGPPPDADVKFKIKSDGFDTKPIVIAKTAWTEESQTHEIEATLTKHATISTSHIKLIDGENCELGSNIDKEFPIGDQTTIFFKRIGTIAFTEPSGDLFQGDKFKITVELKNPAREDNQVLATLKASEEGIFPKNADADDKEVYQAKFAKDAKETEIEIELIKPEDTTKYVANEKTVKISLEVVEDTNVKLGSNKEISVKIKPFPEVYFGTKTPIKDVKKPADSDIYPFRITQKPVLRVKLTDKPPQGGVKVKLSGKAFGTDKKYDVAFSDEEELQEIPVEMVDVTEGDSEEISIEVVDSARLRENHNKLKVKVADCAVFFHDKWINPAKDKHAVGDRVWVRCERKAKDTNNLKEGVFAQITSMGFGKDKDDYYKPRTYDVKFKANETISEPVECPELDIYKSVKKGGDGSRPSKGTGFRFPVLGGSSKPLEVTLKPLDIYGEGECVKKEIEVQPYRVVHFATSHFNSKNEYVIKSKKKFIITLSAPSRRNTIFLISCPAFSGVYKDKKDDGTYQPGIVIPAGKMTRSVEVEFARNPKALDDPEDTEYEINIERVSGNISVFGEDVIRATGGRDPIHIKTAQDLRGVLKVKVITPYIFFDDQAPIKPAPSNGSDGLPILGLDSKMTLKVTLSHKAPKNTKAQITSYAFGGKAYDVEFEEGELSKEIEVHIKKADALNPMTFTVLGKKLCIGKEAKSGDKHPNQIKVRVKPMPAIRFPFPPLLGDRLEESTMTAVANLFAEEPLDDIQEAIDDSERGEWIDPYDQDFVVGDKAKITIHLSQPAPDEGITAALKCKAFSSNYSISLPKGELKKTIDVEFVKSFKSPNLEVSLEGLDRCVTGSEFTRMVKVYKDRPVYFPPRQLMKPDGPFNSGDGAYGGPFIKGDRGVIFVRLKHPAPVAGATAKVTGPFATQTVSFKSGDQFKGVRVTFSKEGASSQDIKLQKGENTALGTKVAQKVLVNTPEVSFASPPVKDPDQVITGGNAWIEIKLTAPAPIKGCSVLVTSPAFKPTNGYVLKIPCGEKEVGLEVSIKDEYDEGGSEKVTIKGPKRCKLGSTKEITLEINVGPRIGFSKAKMTPAPSGELEQDSEATLSIEPNQAPDEDTIVRVKSTAFSGKVYMVKLPKGKTAAVKQKVVLAKGYPKSTAGDLQQQKIILITPKGWQADPTPDTDGETEPNAHVIYIKVKTPASDDTTEKCPLKEAEEQEKIKKLIAEAEKQMEEEPEPDFSKPCNLEIMYLTVKHGDTLDDGEVKRGPASNGTFEVVRDKSLAKVPEKALLSTPSKIPILQVIGGREFYDPHVDDPEETYHYTTIEVEIRPPKKYCNQQFVFSGDNVMQHPMIKVHDRIKGELGKAEAVAARAAARVAGAKEHAEAKIDAVKEKVMEKPKKAGAKIEAVRGVAADKAQKMLDRAADLFEPVMTVKRKVTDTVLNKVGDTLGLEREDDEEEEEEENEETGEERTKRPWLERYEWWPVEPAPGNIRSKFPDPEGDEEVDVVSVFELPVFQAHQIWHEDAETDGDGGDDEDEEDGFSLASFETETTKTGDDDKEQGIGFLRDIMSAVSFAHMKPRQYMIELESCGIPDVEVDEPAQKADSLKAIVEVYPSDEFCVHYKLDFGVPEVTVGAEGKFYDPEKGSDEGEGLKEEEEEDDSEAVEEEEEEEDSNTFSFSLGWEEDEEEEEEEEEEEDEDIEIEIDEADGKGWLEVGDLGEDDECEQSQLSGAKVLYQAAYRDIKEKPKTKKQAGAPHKPSRVFHEFGAEDDEDDDEDDGLIAQFISYCQDEEVYEAEIKSSTVSSCEVDFDVASGGKLSETQAFLDDNLFGFADFDLDFTRNGQTGPFYFQITKSIGASIQAVRAIVAVFNGFSSGCNVTFGWGVEFNISFLEGDLSLYWGWKEYDDHRVFKWYSLKLDLTLISVSAQVNVGFSVAALMVKFQAVIYGKITIGATLAAGFERQTPDTVTPEWLDTWIGALGKAELGVNIVLVHENVFHCNAAIKTGFELKFRISPGLIDRFGVEYMIYWLGVSASGTFKVVGFKEKTKEVKIIEGNPKELPWRRGAMPRKAANAWWNIKKVVNLAWSRAVYQHSRALERLRNYQELQLDMVKASRHGRKAKTDEVPLYRFEGEDTDYEGKRHWNDVEAKFNKQWEDCVEAFNWERKTVHSSILHRSYRLDTRLNYFVSNIEDRLYYIKQRLWAIDYIKDDIIALNEEVARKEEESDDGDGAEDDLRKQAKELSRKEEINIRERLGKRPLAKLDAETNDLRYYALKRTEW
jgi:hypothetical protein